MLLTIYKSRRDQNGNVYYAVELSDKGSLIKHGTIAANNVQSLDCRENLKWETVEKELPIREFNRMVKGWEYLGCSWEDIKANLVSGYSQEDKDKFLNKV